MAKIHLKFLFERRRQIMTVLVRVNNTNVKLPLDPKKIQEPLFNMNFDLVYNQNTTYIYTDFYTFPAKRIIATFYEEIKNSMNTSVANFDLDMVYKINKENRYTRSSPEERLITNFRMACLIENFIVLNSEQNVMVIDVILEPLLLAFGMRQVRKSWILLFKVLELYPSSSSFCASLRAMLIFLIVFPTASFLSTEAARILDIRGFPISFIILSINLL